MRKDGKMRKSPIRIGLVGLGRAGVQMHLAELDRLADEYTLVSGCDIDPARAKAFGERYPDAKTYTDSDAFFAGPEAELVSIAVPSRLHVSFAEKALGQGKIVFLEKPFALSEDGLDTLRKLDARCPGRLFLRQNRRFEACFNHVREIIASGLLGNVFEIKLRRLRHRFRDDWQTRLDCGGGQLNNWAPHLIDQALQFLNYQVESVWSDLKREAALGDAEDHVKLVFRGKTGLIVDIEISDAVPLSEAVITVCGTRGSLVSEDERVLKLKYIDPAQALPPRVTRLAPPPLDGPFVYSAAPAPVWIERELPVAPANGFDMSDIYHYLYAAVRDGVPFPVKNAEGFAAAETMLSIREAHPEFRSAGDC